MNYLISNPWILVLAIIIFIAAGYGICYIIFWQNQIDDKWYHLPNIFMALVLYLACFVYLSRSAISILTGV